MGERSELIIDTARMCLMRARSEASTCMSKRIGVCNLCEAICGLELTIEGRDVVGVRGNPADPLSRGHICPKGVAIADVYADPDRLRRPVRRVGEGPDARWQEIGWDEAFDLVADNLARVINEHGDDALGVYLGNPNAHSLGSMTHGTAMFKSFRTRNRYSATSVDQLPHQLVAHLVFGHQLFLPIPDIDRTSWFLVVGGQPDGLQRLADDGARLPAARCATCGRAAAGWSSSTRAAPRPPRSPTSTTSSARAPTRGCCSRCCTS